VLCASTDCGAPLGVQNHSPVFGWEEEVALEQGYLRDLDGFWRMSNRVKRYLKAGRRPISRRRPNPPEPSVIDLIGLRRQSRGGFSHEHAEPPFDIVCWSCSRPQRVEPP